MQQDISSGESEIAACSGAVPRRRVGASLLTATMVSSTKRLPFPTSDAEISVRICKPASFTPTKLQTNQEKEQKRQ